MSFVTPNPNLIIFMGAEYFCEPLYVLKGQCSLTCELSCDVTSCALSLQSFRPVAMLVERSKDFGRSWKVFRYFAEDCSLHFPSVSDQLANSIDDVVCDSRYSGSEPSTDGEVTHSIQLSFIYTHNTHSSFTNA